MTINSTFDSNIFETIISHASDIDTKHAQQSDLNDSFSPERLKLSQNFSATISVKKRLTGIQVRKPNKQEFIRVHSSPDYCIQTAVLDYAEEGQTYLVDPSLWPQLSNELIPKILYTTITRQGTIRLWPIRLPNEEGKLDDWNQSALEAAEIAKTAWIRVTSNRSAGVYEVFEAIGILEEPDWPDLSFSELLQIAFKDKYFIDNWNHPALLKLRGEL